MIYYYKGGNNMADDVKLKLADAIKQLLSTKPLYKITIKEITDIVGINRQTFYYHFKDIYDLALFMYRHDIYKLLEDFDFSNDFSLIIKIMFTYAVDNRNLLLNTISNVDTGVVNQYIIIVVNEMATKAIKYRAKALHVEVEDEDVKELAEFYTYYISGEIMNWFKTGINNISQAKFKIVSYFVRVNFDHNIKQLAKKNKK